MNKIVDLIMREPNVEEILEEARLALAQERLDRKEFREWLTPDRKAEFINGEIIMHSPAKEGHLLVTTTLSKIFGFYVTHHDLGVMRVEKALVLLGRNDYEPDICVWLKEDSDKFEKDMMVYPAPEFIVEVLSPSAKRRDRGVKKDSYEAHGVREYWIVDTEKETVEQYCNIRHSEGSKFEPVVVYAADDKIRCVAFQRLSIPMAALFNEKACHQFVLELMAD